MNKSLNLLSFVVVSFLIVLISINNILSLAQGSRKTSSSQSYNANNKSALKILESTSVVDIQELRNSFPILLDDLSHFKGIQEIQNSKVLIPKEQQDKIIRGTLLELRLKQIEDRINQLETEKKSLFLNMWFYFWGFLGWVGTIIGGKLLNHWVDLYIIRKYWPELTASK